MNLLSSGDPAVKQILVWMDATAERRFVVQDLNDTHLVINADVVDSTLRALEEHVRPVWLRITVAQSLTQ